MHTDLSHFLASFLIEEDERGCAFILLYTGAGHDKPLVGAENHVCVTKGYQVCHRINCLLEIPHVPHWKKARLSTQSGEE